MSSYSKGTCRTGFHPGKIPVNPVGPENGINVEVVSRTGYVVYCPVPSKLHTLHPGRYTYMLFFFAYQVYPPVNRYS